MMIKQFMKLTAVIVLMLSINDAYAGGVTLNLRPGSLDGVHDVAGVWQHEGGQLFKGETQIGNYVITRRVTLSGTHQQNTAMLTMTIFFLGENPPQNITLQGAHDYSSGVFIGSVSAASAKYNWIRDASFTGDSSLNTLRIKWLGSGRPHLP